MPPKITSRSRFLVSATAAMLLFAPHRHAPAQSATSASAWPWASPSPAGGGATNDEPPARDIPLVEKKWGELSNTEVSAEGRTALAIKPERWKHAETDHFIIHYRRATEAHKVVREIEYDIWFIAKSLGATPGQYKKKSHVFVFEDENEWKVFLSDTNAPPWAGSFARLDELFLSVRQMEKGGLFDSHTLAHETTHAVVARLYPFEHWPVWLNEGFAEYMGGASVATRNHQLIKNYQKNLTDAEMSLDELFATRRYPEDREKIRQLYQTGEKFVRFLMNELPQDRFRGFVKDLLTTGDPKQSLLHIYGDRIKDFDTFEKRFEAFSK